MKPETNPMARISLPTPETMNAEQLRVHAAIVGGPRGQLVGPLRAALHNPELAERWQQFGALLRYSTSLPPIVSELAILVTARRWNSQIEWHIHALAAQKAGLSDAVIEAIRTAQAPQFDDAMLADIYEFTRQLQQTGVVDETVYRRVTECWQELGVVELTAIIGYYTMVSMTLNAHEIPLPDGVEAPLRAVGGDGEGGLTVLP